MATDDVAFDFLSDTPKGKDPDAPSLTLRRYHRLLWSKPLPGGGRFLASHSVIPMFRKERRLAGIIKELHSEESCHVVG